MLVTVHVTVDPEGNVKEVRESLLGFTTPSPFAKQYWSAVETAVKQWKFKPAEFQRVEYVDRAGKKVATITHREPIDAEFDVAFTFTANGLVLPTGR